MHCPIHAFIINNAVLISHQTAKSGGYKFVTRMFIFFSVKVYCQPQVVTEQRSEIDDCMLGEMGRYLFQLFTLTSRWFGSYEDTTNTNNIFLQTLIVFCCQKDTGKISSTVVCDNQLILFCFLSDVRKSH